MGDSSGGDQNCSGITDLKILIENIKDQYKKSNPNDDRWPCPFCFVISKTKVQCNIHIAKDHPNMFKSNKKGFFSESYIEKSKNEYEGCEENSRKSTRQKLARKCKNNCTSHEPNTEETEFIKILKIVEEEYLELNNLSNNIQQENANNPIKETESESRSYEFTVTKNEDSQNEIRNGPCPHCPPDLTNKLYKLPNGLKIHCKKIHPNIEVSNIFDNDASTITIDSIIDKLAFMKKNVKEYRKEPEF